MRQQKYKTVIGALVLNKHEEFVLVEEENGQLNLPCGGLEKETLKEGARREVKEETGLKVKLDFIIGFYCNPKRDGKNVIKIIYAAHPIGGKLGGKQNPQYYSRRDFNKIPKKKLRDAAIEKVVNDYFKDKEYSLKAVRQYS